MKTLTRHVIAALAASALIPATVMGQSQDTRNQGYVIDNHGGAVLMTASGLCVRDGDWTPARSVEPCDPTRRLVAATAPAPAPAPVRVAAAPPAVIAAPAPAPVISQRISFSGDALFAFDKSELKPEGRAMLDDLVRKLNGASYDTITATGHTDRFGSDAYNQRLSERRASAVKDYLVSQNVKTNGISAEGKGETQPMTRADDCKGPKSAKVIACLQPDRRVDVEMRGTTTVMGAR